ncbi:class I SAM-dependent methyltransferase [Candidatus Parcubacteria bacterium]|jgi:SAM-dependent methyltransferase|nr:MAG: class I SAM-dependent methyltransferase [Candidatus Parcubacteria bacterium]
MEVDYKKKEFFWKRVEIIIQICTLFAVIGIGFSQYNLNKNIFLFDIKPSISAELKDKKIILVNHGKSDLYINTVRISNSKTLIPLQKNIFVNSQLDITNYVEDIISEEYQKDFREIDFPNESFDGVWAYTSLLHVSSEEASEVVNKIYHTLKPGGVFLIGMMEGEFEGDKESWEQSERYFKFYTEKELTDMVSRWGFNMVYQERYKPHSKTYLAQVYLK